ncbi:DUF1491 family protein [Sphingosinithalassobacter portus]|uniref:DUF1491 family protein n=1 Tax=Stakelama portus TaxID=2676234 RepID=UPI0013DE0919|nr:DUF1491 family protein [Sphingosinithalassobacter portus]
MARPTSSLLVNALIRRVFAQGGHAAVLAHGDDTAGAILILAVDRGEDPRFYERGLGPDGRPALICSGPTDNPLVAEIRDYWQKRRVSDPDLWVVELDVAQAERFAAETLLFD